MRFIFFALLLFSNIIQAQTWEPLPMHGGGFVTGLIPHPTDENTLFARIDVAGVYKTTDSGTNWTSLTTGIPKDNSYNYYVRSFAIDTTNTDKLYFLSGNAPWDNGSITNEHFLWYSNDAGATWTQKICPTSIGGNGQYRYAGETMLIDSTNTDLIYVGGQPTYNWSSSAWENGGLYLYNKNTDSWTKLDGSTLTDAWITSLQFKPGDSDYIYISAAINTQVSNNTTKIGLWKYQISTGTLTQIRTDAVYDFDFDAVDADKIIAIAPSSVYLSENDGSTWADITPSYSGYSYNYFVSAHPSNADHWYMGYWNSFGQNGIIQTTDGGSNYYEAKYNSGSNLAKVNYPSYANDNYQPGFGNAMATLLFHPANTAKAYVSDWYGVFETTDANTDLITNTTASTAENANWNWTWKTQGIYNMVQVRTSFHPSDDSKYYNCLADIGFYEGTINGTANYQTTHPITSIYNVQFAPSNTNIAYMVGAHHSGKGRIVKTTDNGLTWNEPASGTQWGNSFFETNNSTSVTDLQIADSDEDILIVGIDPGSMSNQVYRSDDGGSNFYAWDTGLTGSNFKTWTAVNKLLKDADGETFYIWHQNTLFKRSLTDTEWTLMTNPGGSSWFAQVITDPSNDNTLYATQYGNVIYKSTDNGNTWSSFTSGASRSTLLSISSNGRLAVMNGEHANSAIEQDFYISDDGGSTWNNIGIDGYYGMVSGFGFLGDNQLIAWSPNTSGARFVLSNFILPVELADFNLFYKNEKVFLNWTTLSETNNQGFEIERKRATDKDWQTIGFIAGQGNNLSRLDYHFVDDAVQTGMYLYRLKQIDFDGEFDYSPIRSITIDQKESIHLYPIPSDDIIYIEGDLNAVRLDIVNTYGQLVRSLTSIPSKLSTKSIALSSGLYYFNFYKNDIPNQTTKVVIR